MSTLPTSFTVTSSLPIFWLEQVQIAIKPPSSILVLSRGTETLGLKFICQFNQTIISSQVLPHSPRSIATWVSNSHAVMIWNPLPTFSFTFFMALFLGIMPRLLPITSATGSGRWSTLHSPTRSHRLHEDSMESPCGVPMESTWTCGLHGESHLRENKVASS